MTEVTDENALEIFTNAAAIAPIIASITEEAEKCKADTSTATGRKAIASAAYKVAQEKARLDAIGKRLVDHHKEIPKKIDATRKMLRDTLDKVRDNVRAPLTVWEQAENDRLERIKAALNQLIEYSHINISDTSAQLAIKLAELKKEALTEQFWNEFIGQAVEARDAALLAVERAYDAATKREEQAAELARLQAEAAARERKEREERIAREAAEKAKAEAAAEAERANQAARDTANRAAEAAARRELELKLAAEQAERRAAEAEARAKYEVEQKKAREDAESKAREANLKHRAKVNSEARDALIAAGLSKTDAETCISAIAKKGVPNVTISY